MGGGCNINPQFPSSNGIITGDLCPTDSNCPSDSSCPSGSDCPTALICPTFGECTTGVYCPTSSDCITGTSCPTGLGCVAGPECEPACPRDLTCPSCTIATQKSHAENLQRLMASSIRNIESYCYTGSYETYATFLSHNQAMAQDSSICEEEEGYLDLKDLACKLSVKSTRANGNGEATKQEVETYLIDDALYICDNNEWTKLAVINSARAIEERDQLKIMTNMIVGSKIEQIDSEQINGENCYKLRFVPDMQVSQRILASQALAACSISPVTISAAGMDLTEDENLLKDGKMIWTAWISAEDHLLIRVESELDLSLPPESLHPPQEVQDLRVEMTSRKRMTFSDFDLKKPFVLPDEAKHARVIPA
ncbi:MAG: hypothetical protein QUS09_09255 [Methanotrichaceae archaeon]|nr:hypothetical protein [Methanotrichaceae archaeon]